MTERGMRSGDIAAAIDVGGSGIRMAVLCGDAQDQELDDPLTVTLENPAATAAQALIDNSSSGRVPGRITQVLMGLSGLFGEADRPEHQDTAARLNAVLGVRRMVVCDDAITAHFGALGARPGVVVAIGTGLVATAWDGATRFCRVGGWGAVGSDQGSGYWIGTEGARAALEMIDGRRAPSLLQNAFLDRYGDPVAFARMTAFGDAPKRYVADFASDVVELAENGDSTSAGIVSHAAAEITRAIRAAIHRAGLSHPCVCITGGLARAGGRVESEIRARLLKETEEGQWVVRNGSPLDGAVFLLQNPLLVSTLPMTKIYEKGNSRGSI